MLRCSCVHCSFQITCGERRSAVAAGTPFTDSPQLLAVRPLPGHTSQRSPGTLPDLADLEEVEPVLQRTVHSHQASEFPRSSCLAGFLHSRTHGAHHEAQTQTFRPPPSPPPSPL